MSDFAPGDLAIWVGCPREPHMMPLPEGYPRPVRGRCYRVFEVVRGANQGGPWCGLVIAHPSPHPTRSWNAKAFRKLNDEPEDIAMVEKIRACKPMKKREQINA